MSWRMHIAVVDRDKAQTMRMLPATHFQKLRDDWVAVQKVAIGICKNDFKSDYSTSENLQVIEDELSKKGLSFDEKKLINLLNDLENGPIEPCEDCEGYFTAFNRMIEDEMCVIEDYCLGRFDEIGNDIGNPFFTDAATQEMFDYYSPRVIYKKDFEGFIEIFRKLVIDQYKEVLQDPSRELRWRGHIEAKIDLWESPYVEPYNLDENSNEIVRVYNLEYRIFELVRLYKSIDWMRDTVILFGW